MSEALKEKRSFVRPAEYDPAPLLIRAGLTIVACLLTFTGVIIVLQILKAGEANTESWAAFTGLIGWATSQVSIIFSNRFGTTQQAAKKDELIAKQVTTAAAVAASVVAGTGSGGAPAVTPAPMNPATGNVPAAEAVESQENKS